MILRRKVWRSNPHTLHEQAASFIGARDAGHLGPSDQDALAEWLGADAAHRRAFEDVERALALASEGAAHPQIMALRSEALAARVSDRGWPVGKLVAGAVAMLLLVVGAFAYAGLHIMSNRPAESALADRALALAQPAPAKLYATVTGERSKVRLSDGSVVTLDTASQVKVAFSPTERSVWLIEGQAIFDVAKNKAVPFQVYAGGRRVTAVGTRFNVRLRQHGLQVALIEGVVRVARSDPVTETAPSDAITMVAGELLDAREGHPLRVAPADMSEYTSWESGLLVFKDKPLLSAVEEINRYTPHPIMVSDPSGEAFRVTGVFKTAEPRRFAEMMAETFSLKLSTTDDDRLVLKSRD